MPPDRPLNEADIRLVEQWVLNGARKVEPRPDAGRDASADASAGDAAAAGDGGAADGTATEGGAASDGGGVRDGGVASDAAGTSDGGASADAPVVPDNSVHSGNEGGAPAAAGPATSSTSWTPNVGPVGGVTLPDAAKSLAVVLQVASATQGALHAMFDEVQVRPDGQDLLVDDHFNSGGDGWMAVGGATVTANADDGYADPSMAMSMPDPGCLDVQYAGPPPPSADVSMWPGAKKCIPISAGGKYLVSAGAKRTMDSPVFQARVQPLAYTTNDCSGTPMVPQ
jgi:hypothetical protein